MLSIRIFSHSIGPKAPPRSKIGRESREQRAKSKEDVREGATAREAMDKSRYVRVIVGKRR